MSSFFHYLLLHHICIYKCIPKYILFSPHKVSRVYVFKADHLALDNQLRCSSLEMTTSPDPNFPQLSVVLCTLLNTCELSICVVLGQLTFGQSCLRHFIVPGSIRRQNLTASSTILWLYSLSAYSSMMFPET